MKFSELKKVSRNNCVSDLIQAVQEVDAIHKKYNVRAWFNKGEYTLGELHSYIAKETQPLSYWDMKIKGVGKLIDDEHLSLNDIGYEEGDYMIIQCAEWEKWFLRSPDEAKCEGCFKIRKIAFVCGCKKVGYCSINCQEKDIQYHSRYCTFME